MVNNPYLEVENEFNTALSTLGIVQCLFTQEQDAPPKDEHIYWALEGVKKDIKRIKEKLLLMA
jgi:hypothetical protein